MKYLKGFGIIFFCLFLGNISTKLISFPIPESVYGMIFLFVGLLTKIVKVQDVEDAGTLLLGGLALFFAPSGVGLMTKYFSIKEDVFALVFIVVFTTFLTMVVTIKTVEMIHKWGGKNE